MKSYQHNLFNSNSHEQATVLLKDAAPPHAANDCTFFDRDLVWSNDHGFARPEESDGSSDATGDLIR